MIAYNRKKLKIALELLQEASIVIANVDITEVTANRGWANQTQGWIDSAIKWRDSYFELLGDLNK